MKQGLRNRLHAMTNSFEATDVDMGGQNYKALCGPANTCDCSHRYLPQWKNEVKGFRCVQDSTPVTGLPGLFSREVVL